MPDSSKISETLASREKWGRNIFQFALIGIAGVVAFYYWGLIVPFVLDTVFDTIKLGIALAALVAVGIMAANPRIRNLFVYAYASMIKWLTRQFVDIDPIGILQTFASRMKERLHELEEVIGSLGGQRDQLAAFIQKNEAERQHELVRAKNAKKLVDAGGDNVTEMRGQLALSGRQAGRLETSNKTLNALLARMDKLLSALKKLRDTSDVLAKDIDAEVRVRTEEFKMITKGFAAFKHAQKLMATDGPEKELYDETLNRLADNYNEKMGQIEYFMEVSKSMINGADLDNMAYEDSALAQLEKWEEHDGGSGGLSVPPITGTSLPPGAKVRVDPGAPAEEEDFGSLFNDKSGQGKA